MVEFLHLENLNIWQWSLDCENIEQLLKGQFTLSSTNKILFTFIILELTGSVPLKINIQFQLCCKYRGGFVTWYTLQGWSHNCKN